MYSYKERIKVVNIGLLPHHAKGQPEEADVRRLRASVRFLKQRGPAGLRDPCSHVDCSAGRLCCKLSSAVVR